MSNFKSQSHTKWDCKYHVVFIPKYRKQKLYVGLRPYLGEHFQDLAKRLECRIEEGKMRNDHVHMVISIPPKHSVARVIGFIKGKSAIAMAQRQGRAANFRNHHFWARGYCVSTVGLNEMQIREYVRNQELADQKSDQLTMW